MQEKSPREVEREFGLKDKSLESLRDRASGFAGMVAAFCQRMKFTQLELLIAKFQVIHHNAVHNQCFEATSVTLDCFPDSRNTQAKQ